MRRAAAALAFLLAAFTFPTAFAGAVDAPATTHQVTVITRTFVDRSRQTPAVPVARVAAAPTRTLVTTIWVPDGRGPFPLVVFAHGYAANPQIYGPVVRPWAEAGFVVAAPAFPVSSHGGPNYAGILDAANQPGDVSFVITRVLALSRRPGALHGKVDPGRIGVGGHSLGAITTLGVVERSCCRDHRVDAAISISGTPLLRGTDFAGKAPPLLLIHGDHDQTVNYAGSTTSYARAAPPKYLLTVLGGRHSDFLGPRGTPASTSVARTMLDFWSAYLRGDRTALRRLPSDAVPGATAMQADPGAVATPAAARAG